MLKSVLALGLSVLCSARAAVASEAFSLLHSFSTSATDGKSPFGVLVRNANGDLFGTTHNGGANNDGAIFRMASDGSGFVLLHSFSASTADGVGPPAGVVLDGTGFLYGVTQFGGADADCPGGCGTVFREKTDGTGFTILHSFSLNPTTGFQPLGGLILDDTGNLYGTTYAGGDNCDTTLACGTVFTMKTDGTGYKLLHSFEDTSADGFEPRGSLVLDRNGYLYGTTLNGGEFGFGAIYKLRTDGAGYTLLYSFSDSTADGASPLAGLTLDPGGQVLYGTTFLGGASQNCGLGCGSVFSIGTDGTDFRLLHSFTGISTEGLGPAAGLLLDGNGNLLGTTEAGGPVGIGTVFAVKTTGADYSVVHFFLNSASDGNQPLAGLVLDGSGNLYGTTQFGGASGVGTVFKIDTGECPLLEATLSGGGTICAGTSAPLTVDVSGDAAPYTVSLTNGGGTQTGAGPFTFHVSPASTTTYALQSATAADGCAVILSGSATVTVSPSITLAAADLTRPCAGATSGEITVHASGGSGALSYSDDGGATFHASGTFSGLPPGTYDVVVADAAGCSASRTETLTALPQLELTPASVPAARQGIAYGPVAFEVSGATGTVHLTLTGDVPPGMRFENGVLSGTPSGIGNSTFTITATDSNGCSAAISYILTVGNPEQAIGPISPTPLASISGR